MRWVIGIGLLSSVCSLPLLAGITESAVATAQSPVTLVEFMDYECPHCRHMVPVIAALQKNHPRLRVVVRVFPAFGEISQFTDSAVLAARWQGAVLANRYQVAVLALTQNPTPAVMLSLAQEVGLDVPQLERDMHHPVIQQQLQRNQQLFWSTGETAIPVILIGRQHAQAPAFVTVGEQSYATLNHEIEEEESL